MADYSLIPRIAALHELQSAYLEPKLKSLDLNFAAFQLLAAVRSAGPSGSQAQIARRLGISPATLSESVQVLIRRGLLKQEPSLLDRRVKNLALTATAKEKLSEVTALLNKLEKQLADGISDSDLRRAAGALDRCIDRFEDVLQ